MVKLPSNDPERAPAPAFWKVIEVSEPLFASMVMLPDDSNSGAVTFVVKVAESKPVIAAEPPADERLTPLLSSPTRG
jgi:hypothetical protein